MLDPGSIPLADLVNFLKPLTSVILVGAVLLILWETAILLGALIASLHQLGSREDTQRSRVG